MNRDNKAMRIQGLRAGTPLELIEFLNDLNNTYNSLYVFNTFLDTHNPYYKNKNRRRLLFYELGYPYLGNHKMDNSEELILPENRLFINKIVIQSPGFWEVLGSLNPLQQIREYLNDRHSRKQDNEWRNHTEREKAQLENELIQRQIYESDNRIMRERIEVLKELGFTEHEIRELIWTNMGEPLQKLGRHQDTGLIGGTQDTEE
jgi:hypothetical protein